MMSAVDITAKIDVLLDEHGPEGSRFRPALLNLLKILIADTKADLEKQLISDNDGTGCAVKLSHFQDNLIAAVHNLAVSHFYPATNPSTSEHLSIVAVGGYGRGTLAPGSDIDLLFLLPYKQTAWGESVVEFILYVLWDLRFKVGHATRSVDECIRLAKSDTTILTSVLEARLICGEESLFAELTVRFDKDIVAGGSQKFIKEKLAERDIRHKRSGESRYLVEPNVKDSKGGLRDLHTLFWIAKFVYGTKNTSELVDTKTFSQEELDVFTHCEDFLWTVRCHLHFLTKRGDDRLTFDKQTDVAERMGFKSQGRVKQVELFMRAYFLVAKDVGDLTRILCAVLEAQEVKTLPRINEFLKRFTGSVKLVAGHEAFKLDHGRLNFASPQECTENPVSMLKLFEVSAKENLAIHPDAYKIIHQSLDGIDDEVRNDPEANASFMAILLDTDDPESILRRLNMSGVLGRFIPEFGKIVAMMQFNMYHHFTVDEHLLRAVGILANIEHGNLSDDHPMSSELIKSFSTSSRRILYLAVLLHDIAKGRQESHSTAGERVARELCPRLGCSAAETDTIAWLVRYHLVMSDIAQRRDLNDFKTILDFTAIIQSPERLKLMLILTVVDIRAVGPGVWNGWKGQLLRTLYDEAEPVVSGGHSKISRTARTQAAHTAFLELAKEKSTGLSVKDAKKYIKLHYAPYWLTLDTATQLAHAKFVTEATKAGMQVATRIHTDAFTAITELTVLAPDHPRLLSLLTGACSALDANIAGAQIFTTTDGMALDTLLIQRTLEEKDECQRAERISDLITKLLHGDERLRNVLGKRQKSDSRLEPFSVEPRVVIDNDSSNKHTVIELTGLDRVGLLHDLTEALFSLNLNIASAHITTYGERAVDVFYVSDLTGAQILNTDRQNTIIGVLSQALAGEQPAVLEAAG
ncbi:[Protein-PII] uridylyltransferase / [Protein-PII]-UMP uridylyl-removing enzyme [hydrothermal vent metagenome]|uniref:[Protein-PII] uridylyltransferase / [Protein-PII]-UMP uridylyl-removing enzyme n=1 Tax=hydrothermal vent metagenome TaxID=652676 RepID=A0A3B0RCM8_9ZZZZ